MEVSSSQHEQQLLQQLESSYKVARQQTDELIQSYRSPARFHKQEQAADRHCISYEAHNKQPPTISGSPAGTPKKATGRNQSRRQQNSIKAAAQEFMEEEVSATNADGLLLAVGKFLSTREL
ncbi:hypothetical protein O6H91_03G104500 [Diphasiastrum complanatum]|uniref:Uncharacterized protein n=1 Tax=Diphasiastrum complanatum TaxID=34168 RepID=A0ACC2EAB5_DIPCM|nr:hypothetical protein O6H91_03G104500 [Diphasiastrum complanatum]